jgi:hypothetical protein
VVHLADEGLERHALGHDVREVLLERQPEESAQGHDREQDHERRRERPAEPKAGVEEDERDGEDAEPDVQLHPGPRRTETPGPDLLASGEQTGEQHRERAEDAVGETGPAAAGRPYGLAPRRRIAHRARDRGRDREEQPAAVVLFSLTGDRTARNAPGATRIAASCGHAYAVRPS